ncbi:MAG TPA: hypothetical protein VHF25_11990 [Nitriliruptorales bacterium]|nr:hypothetical protein [Nitriliruptorales bacterium]
MCTSHGRRNLHDRTSSEHIRRGLAKELLQRRSVAEVLEHDRRLLGVEQAWVDPARQRSQRRRLGRAALGAALGLHVPALHDDAAIREPHARDLRAWS